MPHKELTFMEAAKLCVDMLGDVMIVELTLHPDGLWTARYIKDDPHVIHEVWVN